jgi:hypothetical protein
MNTPPDAGQKPAKDPPPPRDDDSGIRTYDPDKPRTKPRVKPRDTLAGETINASDEA